MLEHCAGDLTPGPFVQTAEQIRSNKAALSSLGPLLDGILMDFTSKKSSLVSDKQ
jgi:hypothetical protein